MQNRWLAPAGVAAAALIAAGCGSSGTPSAPASSANSPTAPATSAAPTHSGGAPASTGSSALKMTTIGGTAVVTNAKGFTLYSFAPDTATTSNCNGSCATIWPPVKGPVTAGSGVTGKIGTITRSDGSKQATYNGHPLYTFTGDSGPGKNSGNGLNASGGIWHEVPVSGTAAPASSPSSSTGGGGYGY